MECNASLQDLQKDARGSRGWPTQNKTQISIEWKAMSKILVWHPREAIVQSTLQVQKLASLSAQ